MSVLQQSVDVSDFVNVPVFISPIAVPFSLFGVPLVLGDSGVIDTVQRVRTYSDIDAVGNDFGDSAPEYLAAEIFFEQAPTPATCMVGVWAAAALAGKVHGATLNSTQQTLANFTAVSSGSFLISIDGVPHAITGISLTSALNLNGVAALIQAQLPAGVTCVWGANNQRFDIKSSTTGATSSVSFASAPTAVGNVSLSGQPSSADSFTFDGTAVTFETSGATGNQVNIGVSETATLAALLTFLNSSTDTNITKMTYVSDGVSKIYCVAAAPGAGGDALTLAKSGTNLSVSGATLAGATGTDISSLLGLLSTSGGYLVPGVASESALAAVQACANASTQWYGLHFASAAVLANSDYAAVASYILASQRTRIFGVTIQNTACLQSAISNDLASLIQSYNNKRVFWMYSSSSPYAAMTMMGRAFTVDFSGSLTTITLAYKQAPGVQAEFLSESQFEALTGKSGNVNIAVNNGATMIWPGQMSNGSSIGPINGYWFDEVHGVDWFQNYIQTNLFNLLYQAETKIPQTDDGDNQIANNIEASCVQAVTNGLVAPGQWNAVGFGQLKTGATLSTGYYVYFPPIATQAQADREARKSVPFQVAAKLAGAIHTVDCSLNINR